MKACKWMLLSLLVGLAGTSDARAEWNSLHYGGYQPWWNIFAKRNRCMNPEEERLQRFWHDYYDAMQRYYSSLDRIDWVAYYKNHGYQINGGGMGGMGGPGCSQRVQYAPVIVTPGMQWATPSAAIGGPGAGPGNGFPGYGMAPAPGPGMGMAGYYPGQ